MNILIDKFPSTLEVEGKEYEINTDFRFALSSILAFEDNELTTLEKVSVMLQNIYGDEIPENVEEALIQCQFFLNAGSPNKDEETHKRRLYSFSQDAGLIYAAFQATHGINLGDEKLHWWRFINLFMDLGQDTTFCQLVSMRKRYYDGKCTKEEKQAIREMWDVFNVPDTEIYSLEEKETISKIKENYRKAKDAKKQTQKTK